jgi:hypothetical protein
MQRPKRCTAQVTQEKASTDSLRRAQQAQQRRGWPEVPLVVLAIDLVFECDPSGEPDSKDEFSLRIQPETLTRHYFGERNFSLVVVQVAWNRQLLVSKESVKEN